MTIAEPIVTMSTQSSPPNTQKFASASASAEYTKSCHRVPNNAAVHQISSKADDFSLIYADLIICNIAYMGHLEFSKLRLKSLCHVTAIASTIPLPCAKFH